MKMLALALKILALLIIPRRLVGGITVRIFNRKYHYYYPMEASLKPDGEEYVQSIVFDILIYVLASYLIFGFAIDLGWILHLNAVPFIGDLINYFCEVSHSTPVSFFTHGFKEQPVVLFLYCVYIFAYTISDIVRYNMLAAKAKRYLETTQY